MHSEIQTAAVTIISYKPLSDLNFARYTGQYGSYMPSSPLESISPWHHITLAMQLLLLPITNNQLTMCNNIIFI